MLGHTKVDPWHPVDSLTLLRLINFHLSYNWSQDLLRDIFGSLEDGGLKSIIEEIVPFNSDNSHKLVTILNEDEMKSIGLFSDEPLMQRYKSKKPIDYREN